MGRCIFKTSQVKRCFEHAVAAKTWSMGYETELKPCPGLFIVHDTGVYLMSNGSPHDFLVADGPNAMRYVVYAEGTDPNLDKNYYDTARALVGGDDFGEIIPIDNIAEFRADLEHYEELAITVTPRAVSVGFLTPRVAEPAKKPAKKAAKKSNPVQQGS